jgi:hypothetical protein
MLLPEGGFLLNNILVLLRLQIRHLLISLEKLAWRGYFYDVPQKVRTLKPLLLLKLNMKMSSLENNMFFMGWKIICENYSHF